MSRPGRHLTARVLAPALLGAGLLALSALTGNAWFLLLAGGCAGVLVASVAVRHRLDDLVLCMPRAARVAVGDLVQQTLHVHNRGRRTSPGVLVTHEIAGLEPVRLYVEPLPAGGRAEVVLGRPARVRGTTGLSRVHLEAGTPLGLLVSGVTREHRQLLVVHPQRVAPDLLARAGGRAEEAVDPRVGPGLDLAGVRDYRPGDDPRHVHWRSTARRGRLVVTERGLPPAEDLDLVVVGPSSAPDWEALVATAAATSLAAQRAGRPVTVTAWAGLGAGVPAPAEDPVALLDWWAALDLAELPDPAALLRHRAAGRPFAVAVSAHVPGGWWSDLRAAAAAAGTDVVRLVAP